MRPLQRIFTEVPPRYDLVNRLFTLGFDERWRRKAAAECLAEGPRHVLDLCTGTGDLAMHLVPFIGIRGGLAALDFSSPMLHAARCKARKRDLHNIGFIEGDAANLPFRDEHFDAIGIAFAFRNLTFRNPLRDNYLAEIFRVIHRGGRFVIVESSQPSNPLLRKIAHIYVSLVAGKIGGILSKQPGAYRYLAYSAINFFKPREIEEMLRDAGFSRVRHTPLLGGVAGITVAEK